MDKLLAIVDQREKGQVPMSIGTALALEGACGIYPDRPESPPPIERAREVWINIRTLIRNLIEAIPTEDREQLTPDALYPALVEEFQIAESAIIRGSTGLARTVYYLSNYAHLQRSFPKAILRNPSTPKQRFQAALEAGLLKRLKDGGDVSSELRSFNTHEIKGKHPEAFIITHLPVDLLSRYSFKKLELLESHTGVLKPHTQWNSKLTGGTDLLNLPFCALTLQLFGDKGNHFSSMSSRLKKAVLEIAEADNWSPLTTRDKMLLSMRRIEDPTIRATLTSML